MTVIYIARIVGCKGTEGSLLGSRRRDIKPSCIKRRRNNRPQLESLKSDPLYAVLVRLKMVPEIGTGGIAKCLKVYTMKTGIHDRMCPKIPGQ